MWKAVLLMLAAGITVGALMPATPRPAAAEATTEERPTIVVRDPLPAPRRASSVTSGGTVAIQRAEDGHFWATADVNGSPIEFMIDTGATVVSLTQQDAERAGINVDPDQFEVVAQGASGPVMGQAVVLRSVSLGDHRVGDVPALILADGGQSLLGQNVLSKFQSVSIENDEMMLR